MKRISAGAVAIEEMPDVSTFVIIFAQNPDGRGERLELQRALTFDEQDHDLGMDTYCLCMASGATHYGGVLSWRLDDGGLVLRLTAEAAAALGVDDVVRVDVLMTPALRAALLAGLKRVLVGVDEATA